MNPTNQRVKAEKAGDACLPVRAREDISKMLHREYLYEKELASFERLLELVRESYPEER